MHMRTVMLTAPLLLSAACGPKASSDSEEQDPDELLEAACASFCARALSCPLGRYAELWDFQDEQTCVSQCERFHADVPSDPPEMCVIIRAELWSCAGAIDSCEMFDAFEDTAFAITNVLGNPCAGEFDEFIHECNG